MENKYAHSDFDSFYLEYSPKLWRLAYRLKLIFFCYMISGSISMPGLLRWGGVFFAGADYGHYRAVKRTQRYLLRLSFKTAALP